MITAPLEIADMFAGGGGASEGMMQALKAANRSVSLTAINHNVTAIMTHRENHPEARHYCASLDSLNPRELYPGKKLHALWASPECTHHSNARGARPINDQSRATAHCFTRWLEGLGPNGPDLAIVENVKEFVTWGPLDSNGKRIPSRKGELFRAWLAMIVACGYHVEWRILNAADYGDPQARQRFVLQAVRHGAVTWPAATHGTSKRPHNTAASIIDWDIPLKSWKSGKLCENTMRRIRHGLERNTEPFIIEYYGQGSSKPLNRPLPTVTCNDRFALVTPDGGYRMLEIHEYAKAMGFPPSYRFCGDRRQRLKQIGNAVCVGLARALCANAISRLGV